MDMSIIEKTRKILRNYPDVLAHYNKILEERQQLKNKFKDYITTTEAAQILCVSVPTVRKMAKEGRLFYIKIGRHMRLDRAEVEGYYQKLKEQRGKGLDELTKLSEEMGLYD